MVRYFVLSFLLIECIFSISCVHRKHSDANLFENKTVGLKLTKPTSWHFLTVKSHLTNLEQIKLKDKKLQQAMIQNSTLPLVIIAKYKEPYNQLNPTLKVIVRSLHGMDASKPVKMVNTILPTLKKSFMDFEIKTSPKPVEVGGQKAAYVHLHHKLNTKKGDTYLVSSEMWFIPKGNSVFMIGVGTEVGDKTDTRKDIQSIIESIDFI